MREFHTSVQIRGREALGQIPPGMQAGVLVGRPYNTCDPGVCLDLPFKLRRMGVLPIPMDYLPLDSAGPGYAGEHMYWKCGREILAAARQIAADPRLSAVYVTSFSCGPDSFLVGTFRHLLGRKPFLEIELDDHTADAGVITRCEAFFESQRMGGRAPL